MSKRPARVLLEDIRIAISKVERYTFGIDKLSFVQDDKTVDAVARNLQIIGEAAARLPAEFTEANPQIEWRKIVGLRHRIVHEYFGVDRELVWEIVQTDILELKQKLQGLLG